MKNGTRITRMKRIYTDKNLTLKTPKAQKLLKMNIQQRKISY